MAIVKFITDLQKMAIRTLLYRNKLDYGKVVSAALLIDMQDVPHIDDLSYDDAALIIEWGNNLKLLA